MVVHILIKRKLLMVGNTVICIGKVIVLLWEVQKEVICIIHLI